MPKFHASVHLEVIHLDQDQEFNFEHSLIATLKV